jgi:two-component system, NtrC family, sensor histidine kinase PilS
MTRSWLRQSLAAHTALRLVVATVLLGLAVALEFQAPGPGSVNPYFVLLGITYGASAGLMALLRVVDERPWTAYLHFTLDAILVSAGVYLTGGVNSLFTTMYALPILAASTAKLHRGGARIAALNAALFVSVVAVQYWAAAEGFDLPLLGRATDLPVSSTALYIVGLNVFGFFAVAMLGGQLAERARRADVELEQATEAIADLQAFNQFVIDSLLSGLATADAQNRLLTLNRSAMAITGFGDELPIGRPIAEVLSLDPATVATIDEDLQRARSKRIDFEFRRPDGRVIDVGLSIAGLPLPDGTRGYLYTFQDVTEVKRMERNARMQQRLAAVGEMAAGIAHEIRNPLASMSGSMQMLRQELSLSGDQAQLMDIVLKESDRLNQTIKSFLAYARPQRAQSTRLDLRTLVTETAMLLRNGPDVGERHAVGLAVGEAEVPCDGDESQMRQILWNLATNALRAMPHGGELTLGARLERGTDSTLQAILEVADRGVGMTPEELEVIFQPFRGKFGKGTGLGLAIVHRIVTDHGGRIDVQSRPGEGTTFTVRFPGLDPVGDRAAPRPSAASQARSA